MTSDISVMMEASALRKTAESFQRQTWWWSRYWSDILSCERQPAWCYYYRGYYRVLDVFSSLVFIFWPHSFVCMDRWKCAILVPASSRYCFHTTHHRSRGAKTRCWKQSPAASGSLQARLIKWKRRARSCAHQRERHEEIFSSKNDRREVNKRGWGTNWNQSWAATRTMKRNNRWASCVSTDSQGNETTN